MKQVGTGSSDYQQAQEEKEELVATPGISSRRRLMKNPLINVPDDLLIDNILLKVPMNSLLNLKCVCNPLRCIITSPAFVNMHLHSTITLNKDLVLIVPSYSSLDLNRQASEKPTHVFYSLNFNATDDLSRPERVEFTTPFRSPRIHGSCNGLLCLSETDSYPDRKRWRVATYSTPCIWNPATKEYKELPTPLIQNPFGEIETSSKKLFEPGSIYFYGFGYDSTINDYKIIRCETFTSSKDQDSITEFQVYTLGTNTWRSISTSNNPYRSYSLACKRQGLFVNGAFHWIMYQRRRKISFKPSDSIFSKAILTHTIRIIALDIEKEKFRELKLPHYLINEASTWDVQILGGCLCIHEDVGYMEAGFKIKIEVWLMVEDGMWTKLFTIVEPPLASPDSYSPAHVKLIRFMENGEILISTNNKRLVLYDPENDTERCVDKLGDIPGHLSYKGVYIESLVSLKSGIYRG